MPIVEFIQPHCEPILVEVAAGTFLIDVVRPLVREGRLAMAWRCGQGTCGACQVYCEHAQSGRWITISSKERNVLIRHAAQPLNMTLDLCDTPRQVRLACHLLIEYDCQIRVKT
ncbi:2Fe-2S iron-sulfur cluster binding domain-containing protein [Chitinibacter bivalviorum]|uniref:2Fe-2S iron-sulfur cluster binding domain-containing protein n=1 Tax=Chitinibacter bivalviorum TaxID=2739434 RepID=A0A7H9BEV7_9NEIS|nr:2Fe-2S iron-sulfur cluster-binding protein [Chitinibacter bivalviorum]QLG87097.1 2Fe-2S iron-sulfur cluster binding domain-containing protein [Chitinibacter bivalviorum]